MVTMEAFSQNVSKVFSDLKLVSEDSFPFMQEPTEKQHFDMGFSGKRVVLLSACGSAIYQFKCNLVAPGYPTDKTFDQLVELMKKHHQTVPSKTVQRYEFNKLGW